MAGKLPPEQYTLKYQLPFSDEVECAFIYGFVQKPLQIVQYSHMQPEDFFFSECGLVFEQIRALVLSGKKTDWLMIKNAIPADTPAPMQKAFLNLVEAGIGSIHINPLQMPEYANMIMELSQRRKVIIAAVNMINKCSTNDITQEEDAMRIAASASRDLTEVWANSTDIQDAGTVIDHIITHDGAVDAPSPTGLGKLDKALAGGFYKGRFYGIAARYKAGKTTMLATISYNLIFGNRPMVKDFPSEPHLYLCLEMSPEEVMHRMLARHIGCNSRVFLKGCEKDRPKDFWPRINAAREEFKSRGLYFASRPRLGLTDMFNLISRAALSGKIKGVILDYMQLVTGRGQRQNMAEHLDNVGQTLAELVKTYPIWIASAAQANQTGGIRGGEGLLNSCDVSMVLRRTDALKDPNDPSSGGDDTPRAWLDMQASRYVPSVSIGSKEDPAFTLDETDGPYFYEHAPYR